MATPLERRNLLLGGLGGMIVGAGAGLGVGAMASAGAVHKTGLVEFSRPSYAQQGEDLILDNIFGFLQIPHPSYIDIGANDPIVGNNTFLFYKTGSHGVLVEPNPAFTPRLRKVRPDDTVLEIGIGASAEDEEADFYLIEGDGQLNTFSKEQLGRLQASKGGKALKGVIKRKLVNINKVLAEYFPKGGPDLFSTDTEGYDLTILRSLDFGRFRPRVFCVETLGDFGVQQEILDLMKAKDYDIRGGTFVNTIFIDNQYVRALVQRASDSGAAAASPP